MSNKYYSVNMSSGPAIRIREDELKGVAELIGKHHPAIITTGGLINSAYYVSITYDKKFMDDVVLPEVSHGGEFDEKKYTQVGFGKFAILLTPEVDGVKRLGNN